MPSVNEIVKSVLIGVSLMQALIEACRGQFDVFKIDVRIERRIKRSKHRFKRLIWLLRGPQYLERLYFMLDYDRNYQNLLECLFHKV